MTRAEAVRFAKAHGLTDAMIQALTPIDSYGDGITELQRQGVTALLALYDGNKEVFAEWVAAEGCGEAIKACRGLT